MPTAGLQNHRAESVDYEGYADFLAEIKGRVSEARVRASLSVNRELVRLYWEIGKKAMTMQAEANWGDAFIELLSRDLRSAFPGARGFSVTNLKYMRQFGETYCEKSLQLVGEIPWGHNQLLMNRLKSNDERLWYAAQTIENGWSRTVLSAQIDSRAYLRHGRALSNFSSTLPPPQSDLVQQSLKDPFSFDFLTLRSDHAERELEDGLMDHVQKMLLEFGAGFAFLGRQYHLEIDDRDFYIDLLFYNVKLRRYFVVELKATEFKPIFTGQLNFYLSAVDDLLRHPDDKETIGLLLCKEKGGKAIAEYALRGMSQPMGVSSYVTNVADSLNAEVKLSLPSQAEIEARLGEDFSTSR